MSTKLELLISDIIEVTINVQTAVSLLRHRPGDVFSIRRLPHRQRSAAGQTRRHLDQALLQLIHIFHRLLVYMMLYTAPNAVVDRIDVEAVGRPEVRRDERWCFTTQKLNRRTCPTNGEDAFGPVSVRVKGQQFENLW